MSDIWSERAEAYRQSAIHAEGDDLDLTVAWCEPGDGVTVLDVATGTGDVALEIAARTPDSVRIVGEDFTQGMLVRGREKIAQSPYRDRITLVNAPCEAMPHPAAAFDGVTIAFGIRNFVDIEAGLREFRRVLRPGGQFICLEFSRPVLPLLDVAYDAYSFNIIPAIGEIITGDRAAYQYLVESIRRFPDQGRFAKLIEWAGFGLVRYENMTGGVVALHRGYKL